MHFVDQATIVVQAGAGGNGCSALFHEPFTRYPRPSGGGGGNGGDVYLVADLNLATLLDFQFRHEFRAERGGHGKNNNKTGARGGDELLRVPVGTIISDAETGDVLRDLVEHEQRLLVARGGAAGQGNAEAPMATAGEPGEQRRLRLELKLIADVGLIGFPNAGKSSLLQQISMAKPKIAAYPFTTRWPVLGVVSLGQERSFVACDIPGLIEGASTGRGLGMEFLRHVERTRVLVHMVDMSGLEGRDPVESIGQIKAELAAYSPILAARPQIIAANKMDLPESRENLARVREMAQELVVPISCATRQGIPELLEAVWKLAHPAPMSREWAARPREEAS